MRTLHQLFINHDEMLLLTEKIEKAYLVRSVFCLPELRNFRHFFQTGSLERSQNSRMLITFFRSETTTWI